METEEFKKQLNLEIKEKLDKVEKQDLNYQQIRYWCEDETRIGLKTITGRLLTGFGVKPIGKHQWLFKYFWIYGLIEPQKGESFYDEFCHLDTVSRSRFLELFSAKYPHDLHIIQLDNGPLHQSLNLAIPENVIFLFQPPYSPEVNPIERLWLEIKKELKWEIFDDLDERAKKLTKYSHKFKEIYLTIIGRMGLHNKALSLVGIPEVSQRSPNSFVPLPL